MNSLFLTAPFPFRRARSWFAIDTGSSAIKIAEVMDTRGGPRVLRTGVLPVPEGAVENGLVRGTDTLSGAIRDFAGVTRGRPPRAVVSIPGRGVLTKRLRIPGRDHRKMDEIIEFEAMEALPGDLDKVNIDYHVLEAPDGGEGSEVLLVAARKTLVENHVELVEAAGLVPAIVEVDHFALRSGCHQTADVLVHVGAYSTTVHVPTGDALGHTTDLTLGGEHFTERLAGELGVPRDEAEAIKRGARPPAAGRLPEGLCDEFAAQVAGSLNLFGALSGQSGPRRVSLSGGSAPLPGLGPSLGRALDAEVRIAGPFFEGSSAAADTRAGPAFAVVAGLVARSPSGQRR